LKTAEIDKDMRLMPDTLAGSKRQGGKVSVMQACVIALILAAIAAAALFLSGWLPATDEPLTISQPAVVEAPEPAPTEPEPAPAPVVPEPEPPAAPIEPALPALDQSDDAVRSAVDGLSMGAMGKQYLIPSNVIERSASLVYLMAQGDVPYKLIPISRPKQDFPISDDGTQVVTDPAGFSRYDALTSWLQTLDLEALVVSLKPFLPLFREAWSYYGEDGEAFDFALLMTLDLIISTPEVDLSEARLIRKEAVWIYEDPTIEGLAAVQKQVLRMGPDNAAIVKARATEARSLWIDALSRSP
jgi:hypothetical protein